MTDFLEMGGKRYRLVEEARGDGITDDAPAWPFKPVAGAWSTERMLLIFGTASLRDTPERFFPNAEERKKAERHIDRVLKSLRLYENAKATGTLDELWVSRPVHGECSTANMKYVPFRSEWIRVYAQAGRLFATEAEARAFAEWEP